MAGTRTRRVCPVTLDVIYVRPLVDLQSLVSVLEPREHTQPSEVVRDGPCRQDIINIRIKNHIFNTLKRCYVHIMFITIYQTS